MEKSRKEYIDRIIAQKKNEIKDIEDGFFGEVIGVSQALSQLKNALEKVNICLDRREFEKASSLGYGDVSSEFIFLQRCLGGLNDTVGKKQKLIQDVCIDLCEELDNVRNEEITPLIEQEIESLNPIESRTKIEICLGKNTAKKLHALHKIRHTPIEHLVELILASSMQNDEQYWRELENSKLPIANLKNQKNDYYSSDEVTDHIEALSKQERERIKNLY